MKVVGYPFETTPLNDSLTELNHLSIEEVGCYKLISDDKTPQHEKELARKQLNLISEKKKTIRNSSLLPREYDIYLSELTKAVTQFEKENPRPDKSTACIHLKQEKRLRTLVNKMTQVISQCLDCGSLTGDFKKINTPNWQTLPLYNSEFRYKRFEEYKHWEDKYREVVNSVIGEINPEISFNQQEFELNYKNDDPTPFSFVDCEHDNTQLTLRVYSASDAVVEQCKLCGHHVRSVSKKQNPNWKNLPEFHEKLKPLQLANRSQWYKKYSSALMQAIKKHHLAVTEKIKEGEITVEDKSTFGTYYNSPEWRRTRQRILNRDEHQCQSCNGSAQCVHHIVYDRLGCENDLDLISLCNNCHDEVHHRQNLFGISYRLSPNDIKTLSEWQFAEEEV